MNMFTSPRIVFEGQCFRYILTARCALKGDMHVMISEEVEDDGNWFRSQVGEFCSGWIDEHVKLLSQVKNYLENSCDKEPDGYGYKFRR